MDYKSQIEAWKKENCFIVENNRIKEKRYIFTTFPKINTHGFSDCDVRRLVAADVEARFLRFTYKNVLFPVGYNSLANTAFVESKRFSNTIDDSLKNIFKAQIEGLGVGINEEKEIDMRHNEYLSILQQAFIDMYDRGYIKYGDVKCYYDKKNKKIYDNITKPATLSANTIKSFYLDIKNLIPNITKKINDLNIDEDTKLDLVNQFMPKEYLSIELSLTNGESLNLRMDEPQYLGGVAFILLNPNHIDITSYMASYQVPAILRFFEAANDEPYVFSGLYAKNPLTGADIPVYISLLYDKPYYIGIPSVDDDDKGLAIDMGLEINNVVKNGTLINSDFITNCTIIGGKEKIIEAFVESDMASIELEYNNTTILLSQLDSFGALFPFLEDNDEKKIVPLTSFLPYAFSAKLRPELSDKCDIVGTTMEGTINSMYIEGITPFLSLIYDHLGSIYSIFSKEAIEEYIAWKGIDTLYIKECEIISTLFMYIVFMVIIENECRISLEPPKNIIITSSILDGSNRELSKKNNNYVDFGRILDTYSPDAIRLFVLSTPLDKSLIFDVAQINNYNDFIKMLNKHLMETEPSTSNVIDLEIYNLSKDCYRLLDEKRYSEYIFKLIGTISKYKNNPLSKPQVLKFIKLLYPICPFLAEDIYKNRFNGKYSIANEDWPE